MRKLALGATLALPLATMAAPAQAAGPEAVVVAGTGSITPGLPCPTSCNVHLDFQAAFSGTIATGVATCTFDGTTGADTAAEGHGDGHIHCEGGVSADGDVHFDRTGPLVTVTGSVCVGSGCGSVTARLLFAPSSAPTVTSFAVAGAGVIV